MQIYLPIAEMSLNAFLLFGLGGIVGLLSGLFGVGGGFLLTPMLLLIGVPPAVAVGTQGGPIIASSFSGFLGHLRRKTVDLRMGLVLLVGGMAGSALGVQLFAYMRALGQVELMVTLAYVIFLGVVGGLMLTESLSALRRTRTNAPPARPRSRHGIGAGLPLKIRFRQSQLYISVFPPLLIGAAVGVLAAIMGVGGGFVMVPAMIYLLNMPTKVVIGTSLFQVIFVAAFTLILHATENYSVDAILGLVLLLGGVIGAQIGVRLGVRLRAEQLRILLAILVLAVGAKLAFDLVVEPSELYSLAEVRR